ncbi:hypothetical protein TWF102_000763 [Orbilia oligospora]|uniref:F-box domain-containing protein n=1 Tax=Orbilia oligospora TaxID=2813651 RepID=A0A7C8J1W8_ORBOL|nr:hypothetical protein TWF102_000763 [Orbilia oligospora]KAF3116603.1 hypothetical protein TWF103_008366 [Orbilia oligospora]
MSISRIVRLRYRQEQKPTCPGLPINPPGQGPLQQVLNTAELLSNILENVGLPTKLTSKDSVSAFISLSKCLRVCKKWNATILGFREVRQKLYRDDKILDANSDDKAMKKKKERTTMTVAVCEPFVREVMRWANLKECKHMGPGEFLKRVRFPANLYFTQPPVREVSFTFSMIYGRRIDWVCGLFGGNPNEYMKWDKKTETLRYFCESGVKVGGIAEVLQTMEEYLIRGTMLGVAIGAIGCGEESEGLPVWIDYDGEGMDGIRESTGGMPEVILDMLKLARRQRRFLMA